MAYSQLCRGRGGRNASASSSLQRVNSNCVAMWLGAVSDNKRGEANRPQRCAGGDVEI